MFLKKRYLTMVNIRYFPSSSKTEDIWARREYCLLTYVIYLPSRFHTHRLWLLCNAAAETNPELSHSEADEEAAAVSSLSADVSLRLSSCSVLPEPQTHAGN